MPQDWPNTTISSGAEALRVLTELRGRRWLCRGHSQPFGGLVPSIDREPRQQLSRVEKLTLERQSIDLFRSTARFFSDEGEKAALVDDIVALMVLRHNGVPTRLLDWTRSPWVAAYFAVRDCGQEDGELWAFDEPLYEKEGRKQWERWPETTKDGRFSASLTAFSLEEPPDWFVCHFYPRGFARQSAQAGAYTMTARFSRDHADAISQLLHDPDRHHLYVIAAALKPNLRKILRERFGTWRGSLFPDAAGAAALAATVFSESGA